MRLFKIKFVTLQVKLLTNYSLKHYNIMTQEKQHLCEVTLQDMYALQKRSKELAREMVRLLDGDNDTARNYMQIAGYMSECATMPLFNCSGALGIDLAKWSADFDKGYDKVKEWK